MDDDGTGMRTGSERLYLVDARILPEAILKTAEVGELLKQGKTSSIGEATRTVGISRSAYYRYKDFIHPFNEAARQRIVTLSMELRHESGVLSNVLTVVANHGGNILTINQGIPTHGTALASLSVDTSTMPGEFEVLISALRNATGVRSLEIVGKS